MEKWLTGTIPGIVILGAAGSLLAVVILSALRLVPSPLEWHRDRTGKQAYMLGFTAATIERDETGRTLITALVYHLCLMVVYLTGFTFCGTIFLIIIALQFNTALTWGGFISSAGAFTLAYLIYFEFEFIYRTYLFHWKSALQHMRGYKRSGENGSAVQSPAVRGERVNAHDAAVGIKEEK